MDSLPSNLDVAQTGSLPGRRLAVGSPAGCQPATQQTASLRYIAAASGYGAPRAHKVRGVLSSILNGGEGAPSAGEEEARSVPPVFFWKWDNTKSGRSHSAALPDCDGAPGVGQSRQGRPGIAHRFIGGNGLEETSETRQGRKKGQGRKMILPSHAGLVPQPPENPALKRWANKAALTTHTDDRARIVDC